ncbi:MAG: hypothetical protein DRQ88_11865 [Epsilonproteobacteria bacterium]|nr:MAG: hypothetical protein DRQ89_11720 [Campylobacterota bacterium]RLA63855.1 MAG: hypothetical protein DRQ88_11865 [Campylobacterota bacterium]
MDIRLIVIGDELLSGRIADKNGQQLGKILHQKGLNLRNIEVVGDCEADLLEAFKGFENKITLVCGGLGPTKDDITKNVVAKFFNLHISISNEATEVVKKNYQRRDLSWIPEANLYHHIPTTITPLNNPTGLAPGLAHLQNDYAFICLPGVPIEFEAMMVQEVFPLLEEKYSLVTKKLGRINIRTFGVPEEAIFHKDTEIWKNLANFGKVASLPNALGVDIEVSNIDLDIYPQFEKEIKNVVDESPLKDHVWQYGDLSLEGMIINLAQKKNIMIGLAESCTGGLVSHRLTNIPGCSSNFLGAIISYTNEIKSDILKVKEKTINDHGAVSSETAKEMAKGAAIRLGADLTISLTGIAGPDGGTAKKPVGTLGIGYWYKGESGSEMIQLRGNRKNLKYLFSQKALFTLFFLLRDN